jgi:hypothetical protein
MVTILNAPAPKKNIWGRLGATAGQGLEEGFERSRMAEAEALKHERTLELQGNAQALRSQQSENKSLFDKIKDQKRTDAIRMNFGDRAAELYESAPEGGKTAIINSLLEARQRGLNFDELLGNNEQEIQSPQNELNKQRSLEENELKEKPSIKAIDYDKGLTPKERVRRQEERYSKNLPIYQASQAKIQGIEAEKDALNILSELSPQIKGWQKLNINPSTGELIIPALASPEAQRFVKTINDFTTKAKDSYGARVSNFELDRFMKRLPTLANSPEGRTQIIRQMQIINNINAARELALDQVIDEHGGIRNIDFDQAERMADKVSRPMITDLKKEFTQIDNRLDKQYDKKINETKKNLLAPGRVMLEKDGKKYSVPQNQVKKALSKGYNKI